MNKILIVGATSAIAQAVARRFAQRGDYLFLVARNPERLQALVDDLKVRGCPKVAGYPMDANDFAAHAGMLERAEAELGGLDIVLIAHGTLPDQAACAASVDLALDEIRTNALSVVSLATLSANRFERQGAGALAVISSVAGDRGRQSNYVYGSAKALVSTFLSGLRQRLYKSGVAVVTIKPGFVDTPMTKDFKKGPLWASADGVAKGIVKAIDRRKSVVYLPFFWRGIMWVIRSIPEFVFKRIQL
jgi:decaprenylphospho-beta-D-erythro-pentofuranosid-2-ulose 2-reductase